MPKARSIPSLTGVRGIAALWVFMTHFYGLAADILHQPWMLQSLFLFNGFRGVDLFFVLSGFILMHVHEGQFTVLRWRVVRDFFIVRFFRVYPLNTFVLLAMVPLVLLAPGYVAMQRYYADPAFAYRAHNLSLPGFVQTLLLVQSWTVLKLGEWNIVSWTLSAEVLGYILFPLLAMWAMRISSPRNALALCACSLVTLVVVLFACHHANNNPTGTFGAIRMFFCFVSGILLYRAYHLLPDSMERHASSITSGAVIFIAATLFFPVAPVLDVFGFTALIFGLAYQRGAVDALLRSGPVIWLGRISFSFYLTHYLLIGIISWSLGEWLRHLDLASGLAVTFAIFGLCLIVGTVCYHLVERPSQRLGRRVMQRVETRDAMIGARRTA
ncbi:acyltransferase family protein [Komagataeibacter oboediens]|uniref:Acyltransferase n=1 Tax=Komagataeibacter oboediens TaxID=65958 RepID=A0ABS5SP92_9PROT|nr:acyltransferase [Komagataeibacter oboediens]MBL7234854.1 acyltransferase [Komagataeibacter oboediens]MBT0675624.1 acyltransferase [Komagataeibacter oboediens]MBT0679117.1 acyltransferase [Komagataeibacter oboediens]